MKITTAQEAALYATPNSVDEMATLTLRLLDDEPMRQAMGQFGFHRAPF
ncbi:MAG: hypothetical protein R2867_17180 [Caldilineaceae bacterium]